MYSEEMKASSLAKLFAIYDLALVDTSSLMEDSFPVFMDVLANSKDYWKEGFKVVLLGDCLDELNKHSKDKKEHLKAIAAKQALKIIKKDQKRNKTFEIRKSLRQDIFADAALMSVATAEHIHNKLLVITQDKNLTRDLLNLNNLESQRGRWLKVYRLDENGTLVESEGVPASSPRKEFSFEKNKNTNRPSFPNKKDNENKVNPLLSEAIKKDQMLNANLSNRNYPEVRKKNDIESQLSLLAKLTYGEKDKLKLSLPEGKLKETLNNYKNAKKEEKPLQKPAKKVEEKPTEKPFDLKKPTEKPSKNQTDKTPNAFFYSGASLSEAFGKLAASKGWILRDPSVPYFSGVHGPYDISLGDMPSLEKLGDNLKGDLLETDFKGLSLLIKKEGGSMQIALSAKKKEEPLIEAKKEPTPKKAKKPIRQEPEKKESESPVETQQATLIVAVPENAPAKKKASKKADSEKQEAKEKTKKEPSSSVAKTAKSTKSAKITKEEKTEPKAESKSAKKVSKKKDDNSKLVAEAQKADSLLNANLNNPNYPDARSLADINAQLTRLQALTASEKKGLLLPQAQLESRAKELKEKISQTKKAASKES